MFSPSDGFQCSWRRSRRLLFAYGAMQALALFSLLTLPLPTWLLLGGLVCCAGHALWVLPRQLLLRHRQAFSALRHDQNGWALWSQATGWLPVQLLPSSVVLASWVVLHFRRSDRFFAQALCIASDAMDVDAHRRLRVQLKFSPQRWRAAE